MKLADILREYLLIFPDENGLFELAKEQVAKQSDIKLKSRKNFVGHFTAAAFLISKDTKRVLLLEHKALKKMLQPGGHMEPSDNDPLDTAYRELKEETGIEAKDVQYRCLVPGKPLVPFDFDTHFIPDNPKKDEASHYHHDMRYLFMIDHESSVAIDPAESNNYEWTDWQTFINQPQFKKVAKKIETLIATRSAGHFFEKTYAAYSQNEISNVGCVAVQHILPSTHDYILYLNAIFHGNLVVFAKPKSIDERVKDDLARRGVTIKVANRKDDTPAKYCLNELKRSTVIIDIGGYFAKLATKSNLPILGIVEDTENGYQKYCKESLKLKYPVMSVARSPLKQNEDYLVGESIVHAADSLLRLENILIDYCQCSVIGYGKVGSGVASTLLKKNIKPFVSELDPIRLIKAIRDGCYAIPVERALSESKVIFCATGMKSLSIQDFRNVRNGAYIISVTSSDDEFDLSYLKSEYSETKVSDRMSKFSSEHNYFYILNHGNAVNFLFNAALGPFIHLVQAEILTSMLDIMKLPKRSKGILETKNNSEEIIAAEWLKEFISSK